MNLNAKTRDPLSLLILLGFVCQGFAWENYVAPVLTLLLWVACAWLHRPARIIPKHLEFLCLFAAIIMFAFFNIGSRSVFRRSLDVGNALLVIQALWMLRPVTARERLYSLAMAITQLAIGAQVIVDYEFILLLAAAIVLIPKALHETAAGKFEEGAVSEPFRLREWRAELAVIAVVMALFFVLFPRGQILTRGFINVGEAPLSPRMDMVTSAFRSSDRPLFQISGESIGPLKSYTLDTFDGRRWIGSQASQAMGGRFSADTDECLKRRVDVKSVRSMGNALPTDGDVVNLTGDFFLNRYLSEQGGVFFVPMWGRVDGFYEYWIRRDGKAKKTRLTRQELRRYTSIPKQSERLEKWISETAPEGTAPLELAKKLEGRLKTDLVYELGVPNLDEQNPVDDFIFNQKRGHCERFASALAVMLRMRGVPSRIVIGYVPGERNQFADFHTVTANDAHAWVEAYTEGAGWTAFDGTAPSEGGPGRRKRSVQEAFYDWIEYVWYSKIVSLSESDQKTVLRAIGSMLDSLFELASRWRWALLPAVAALAAGILITGILAKRSAPQTAPGKRKTNRGKPSMSSIAASGFYGRMLKLLAKRGLRKAPTQTPLEFQEAIDNVAFPRADDTRLVSKAFCDAKYGEKTLEAELTKKVDTALSRLRE